jgi:hypothetical protein
MKMWRMLLTVAMVLPASRALAENWVTVATDNDDSTVYRIDKDSIRRGNDGLVYYSEDNDEDGKTVWAANCQGRVLYVLKDETRENPDWRNKGEAVASGSIGEFELKYVCANVQ